MFKNCEKSTRFAGGLSFQLRIEKTDLLALNIEQALVPWNANHHSIANHHQTFRSSAERNAPPISNNIHSDKIIFERCWVMLMMMTMMVMTMMVMVTIFIGIQLDVSAS